VSVEDNLVPEGMERFLKTELSRDENREAVRRLLAGTPRRPSQNRADRSGLAGRDATARYDEAFRKTERRLAEAHERVQRERELAAVQWSSLDGHPPARRLIMARNDERLHHWGLFDLLLEKSREILETDATAAVGLAELSHAVAERLDPDIYGEERVSDFKTAALAALGDARRRAGDLAGARLAFSQARINLEMGTGDLLEEAGLLGSLVKLLCDLGEYGKAAQSLERASALYRRIGDAPLAQVKLPRRQEKKDEERLEDRKGLAG
jgi:tetratricopeptide (TPR) repeat protein